MPQLTPQAFVIAVQVENNPHLGSANLAQGEGLWGLTLQLNSLLFVSLVTLENLFSFPESPFHHP